MFFFLSKILWFITNPFNIILILLVSGWILMYRKPKIGKKLVGVALMIILLAGMSPLPNFMMRTLENRIPAGTIPAKIDGIIVLSGMVNIEASRGELIELTEQADRIIDGIILARKHPEAKLIITGGSGSLKQGEKFREADYLEKLSISLGIDKDRLIGERDSRNTHEHAIAMSKMLSGKGQWVLIT
ncbi:MAG: YdcF family protein, partial [Odoribacter sp.]|nr:YdcF family protein [Odoribacter sp.]